MKKVHGNTGKKRTEEQRKRIGDSIRGKKRSKEFCENLSNKLKGREITWGEKISKSLAGVPRPDRRGENCNFWRGGTTKENAKIRSSLEYRQWRKAVFERDNYTCVECGDKSKKNHRVILRADHIKPFAFYPELRFDINNGRTLCDPCHKKTPTFGKKTI